MPPTPVRHASILLLAVSSAALWCGISVAQTPPPGSIALRWNDCYGDGGTTAHTFACDTNSGIDVLVVSAFPPVDMDQLVGAETDIRILFTTSTVPSWWSFMIGGCRGTIAMHASFEPPATASACLDPWLGQASGGSDFQSAYLAPNQARLRTICSIPGSTSVTANSEVFIARVVLLRSKTVGSGSCVGCPIGACIGLESVSLYQPLGVGDYTLVAPLPNTTSDVVGWQMDAHMPEDIHPVHAFWEKDFLGCSAAVTAGRRPTWGAVKSLYR